MKLLIDFFPLLIFFVAFKFYDIYIATAATIVAAVLQIGWLYIRHRRIEKMHLTTLALLLVFGGLTLILRDEIFIKWKPTIVNWLFAIVIFGMHYFGGGKSAFQQLLGKQMELPTHVWRKLSIAWGIFFSLMGALNLYVAFYYNLGAAQAVRTETWVNFKVFGMIGLSIAFIVAQTMFIMRYLKDETP